MVPLVAGKEVIIVLFMVEMVVILTPLMLVMVDPWMIHTGQALIVSHPVNQNIDVNLRQDRHNLQEQFR